MSYESFSCFDGLTRTLHTCGAQLSVIRELSSYMMKIFQRIVIPSNSFLSFLSALQMLMYERVTNYNVLKRPACFTKARTSSSGQRFEGRSETYKVAFINNEQMLY